MQNKNNDFHIFLFDNYFIPYLSLFSKILFHSLPSFKIKFQLQQIE